MKVSAVCSPDRDGFRGYFYDVPSSGRCMVIVLGDDGNDFMSKACARWFFKYQNCSVLCIGLRTDGKEDPGINLWNLNQIESAVNWLHGRSIQKIGICGMSIQAAMALSAAARIPFFSLVIAFSPCDFVPWGFLHGPAGKEKNAEYPTGNSAFTWNGEALPFQAANLSRDDYYKTFQGDSKRFLEMHSKGVFEKSEAVSPVPENAWIPAENIRGALILVGAEDDSMWNSTRYIHRMRRRLTDKHFMFPVRALTYRYGTHLLLPQRMVMDALPVIGGFIYLMFASGRKNHQACRSSRIHLDRELSSFLQNW